MASTERTYDRARFRATQARQRIGTELRIARRTAGRSQAEVASAARTSQAQVGRIERGVHAHVAFETLVVLGAMVGLDVVASAFAGPGAIRDAAQVRLLTRSRTRLGPGWAWRYEVPVRQDDQRAWDARIRHHVSGATVMVEAETSIHDIQALLRRVAGKREAAGDARLILLVADTHRNRAAMAAGRQLLAAEFPCSPRRALRALDLGQVPSGDAVLVLGPGLDADRRRQSPGD